MIRSVGIFAVLHWDRVIPVALDAIRWLQGRGVQVMVIPELGRALQMDELSRPAESVVEAADLILSLGGDGTLLRAARLAAPLDKPILGVHLGGLGFLAEVTQDHCISALEQTITQGPRVQERMMLRAEAVRAPKATEVFHALNDVVVSKADVSRLVRLRADIDGQYLSDIRADGIVIATPTGSTAYSLAAGGPVVDSQMRALVLTQVCPHSLTARPLVTGPDHVVRVLVPAGEREAVLTADGQVGCRLAEGDAVLVSQAEFSAKLVSFDQGAFYAKLREKLQWGERGER